MVSPSTVNSMTCDIIDLAPSTANLPPHPSRGEAALSSSRELQRFAQRSQALDLGYELPLTTSEAGAYIGLHPKTVERMARDAEIPAHPVCGVRRKTWKLFASELDVWLRSKVDSPRHPCSPDGKEMKK